MWVHVSVFFVTMHQYSRRNSCLWEMGCFSFFFLLTEIFKGYRNKMNSIKNLCVPQTYHGQRSFISMFFSSHIFSYQKLFWSKSHHVPFHYKCLSLFLLHVFPQVFNMPVSFILEKLNTVKYKYGIQDRTKKPLMAKQKL